MSEIEKQFFDTFGIEPKYKSLSCDGWTRTTAVAYFTNLEEAKKFGLVFQEEPDYPQITDRILLELILLQPLSIEFKYPRNIEELKNTLLGYYIEELSLFAEPSEAEIFRQQVRTLFEEVENE